MVVEWTSFPIKQEVVQYLDFESRCTMRLCSKADKALIDSSHFVPEKLEICEIPSRMDDEKSIIRVKIDSFTVWFIGKNEKTKIERAWNNELEEMSEVKDESRFDVFRRFIDKFANGLLEAKNVRLDELTIEPSDDWKIKCQEFELLSPGTPPRYVISWLSKVSSKLEKLLVVNWNLEGIAGLPQITTVSKSLCLTDSCEITDEQIMRISATDIHISSTLITPVGIKAAFERFLKFGNPEDSLGFRCIFPENFDPTNIFPENLIFKKGEGIFPEEKVFKICANKNEKILRRDCYIRCTDTIFTVFNVPETDPKKTLYPLWPFTRE